MPAVNKMPSSNSPNLEKALLFCGFLGFFLLVPLSESNMGFPALRTIKFEVDRRFQYKNEIYLIVGAQIMAHWKRRGILILSL